MADNIQLNAGTGGATLAADDILSVWHQRVKVEFGVDGSATDVSASNPLPVDGSGVTQPVSDAGGSLTVDSAQLPSTIGQKAMAASVSVAIASDQGNIGVTDGGTSLTVDFTGQKTGDYDSGAGTDTVLMVGLALPASGGAVQGGTSTNPLRTDPTGTTTQPVSAASLPLPSGAATESTLSAASGKLPATLGQKAMTASMAVVLASDQSSIPVTGTFYQATQPVSGTVTANAGTGTMAVSLASVPSHAVTNAGTFAVQDSEKVTDNAAFTDGTTKVQPAGFIYDEVAGTALTENDAGAARMDVKRAQVLVVEDATTRGQRQAVNSGGAAEVHGDIAHDSAVSGNPVRIAGRARTSDYTSVASDDVADFITDLNGKQIVLPYSIPENAVSGAITSAMTGTTSTSLVAAPGAGLRNYITTIIVSNSHATVGTDVIIQDGSGGTTLLTIPAAAVYGGAVITLPTPLRQPTANTALYCANVTTGSSTKVSAVGFKAP